MRVPATPIHPSPKSPPLAGLALGVYVVALVYASLYPWRGWRSFGWAGLHFVSEPWPRYWTWFDVFSNVAVYLPLGALVARVSRRRLAPAGALLLGLLAGSALSFALESLQSYLPGRVPSRLDWLTNTLGALIGATVVLAAPAPHAAGEGWTWHRPVVLKPHASSLVTLVVAWLLVQWYPQRLLFGSGDVLEPLMRWLRTQAEQLTIEHGLSPVLAQLASEWLPALSSLQVPDAYAVIVEAGVAASAIVAIGMLVADALQPSAPRGVVTGAVIALALMAKVASSAWLLEPGQSFGWLTAGAQAGLVLGLVLLALLGADGQRARLWTALAALAVCAVASNMHPVNAYQATLAPSPEGASRNFQALLHAFALLWPYAAMGVVLARLRTRTIKRPRL